jgi:hypothetical protein
MRSLSRLIRQPVCKPHVPGLLRRQRVRYVPTGAAYFMSRCKELCSAFYDILSIVLNAGGPLAGIFISVTIS